MQYPIPEVQADFVKRGLDEGKAIHFVDVRSAEEFDAGHAKGAVSMPMDRLDKSRIQQRLGPAAGDTEPVYLICTAGVRARQTAARLKEQGMDKVIVVEGGTQAWEKRGLPLARPSFFNWKFPATPQRQAELFTGMLILLFALKGLLLHPFFMGIAGLAGISLMISATSERYSLARVFANMPWNRRGSIH
jgi:rhodanese-related sulfurtransferase